MTHLLYVSSIDLYVELQTSHSSFPFKDSKALQIQYVQNWTKSFLSPNLIACSVPFAS